MTELERMLKDALTRMEQETSAALQAQKQELTALREKVTRLDTEQQQSARLLHDLCAAYKSLEPLLTRLSGIVNADWIKK
jgi:chromosome segregation ATPase